MADLVARATDDDSRVQIPRVRRRIDPDRRRRIVEAALRVVSDRGVEGLTFRAAAQAADVPLGSTTYHFRDKDELLASVVALARERNALLLRELVARHIADGDLAAGVAAMVEEICLLQRKQLVVDYELFLAAMHRPSLRQESARWAQALAVALEPVTDEATALSLAYALDGMLVHAVVLDRVLLASDVEPIFRRIIAR